MLRRFVALSLTLWLGASGVAVHAADDEGESAAAPGSEELFGPYCVCFETEPAMDFGGRSVNSIQTLLSGLVGRTRLVEKAPAVQLAWELPMSLLLLLVQHEVMGHGGRGREFDLGPSYGFGFDFSAYTEIDEEPQTTEQVALLASGGTEATAVATRRMMLDLYQPGGGDGALAPLALIYKLDLPLYLSQTEKPRPPSGGSDEDFEEQYRSGNDMAIYMVTRQGLRREADALSVWERTFAPDYGDPGLSKTWRDVRDAAAWALLDPAVIAAVAGYAKQHIGKGSYRVKPPVWQLSEDFGMTLGTRSALGPAEVSRYLDVYFVNPHGVGNAYVRDLESTIDHTFGTGVGFHRASLGSRVKLGVQLDWWKAPAELVDVAGTTRPVETHWHAGAEIDVMIQRKWGLTAKLGAKSDGYLPGYPEDGGAYIGFGVLFGL